MAYESRGASGRYLYWSYRDPVTGRVKKKYLGRGAAAEAFAHARTRDRHRREADRLAVETVRDDLRALDDLTAGRDAAVTLLLEATLLAAGYYRPNYGPWRRRRHEH